MTLSSANRTPAIWRVAALLAAFALLFGFFGPALDHHFAERQVGHAHLALGESLANHSHFYEEPQAHSHAPAHTLGATGRMAGAGTGGMEIVFLTANDGSGASFAVLAGPSTYGEFVTPDSGDSSLLLPYSNSETRHLGVSIPLPKRPPRI